mgnify:CR=1 FL=1
MAAVYSLLRMAAVDEAFEVSIPTAVSIPIPFTITAYEIIVGISTLTRDPISVEKWRE